MSLGTKFLLSKIGTYGSIPAVLFSLNMVQAKGMSNEQSVMYVWMGILGFFALFGCVCYIWKRILEDIQQRQLDADRIYIETLGKTKSKDWK